MAGGGCIHAHGLIDEFKSVPYFHEQHGWSVVPRGLWSRRASAAVRVSAWKPGRKFLPRKPHVLGRRTLELAVLRASHDPHPLGDACHNACTHARVQNDD